MNFDGKTKEQWIADEMDKHREWFDRRLRIYQAVAITKQNTARAEMEGEVLHILQVMDNFPKEAIAAYILDAVFHGQVLPKTNRD